MRRTTTVLCSILAIVALPTGLADTMQWSGHLGPDPSNTMMEDGIEMIVTTQAGGTEPSYDLGSWNPRSREDCVYSKSDYDNDGTPDHVVIGYVYEAHDGPRCVPYVRRGGNKDDGEASSSGSEPDPEPEPEPVCEDVVKVRCVTRGYFTHKCYDFDEFEQEVCSDEDWDFGCGPWSGFPFQTRDCGWEEDD